MAASLRSGFSALLQSCKAWSKHTVLSGTQLFTVPLKTASSAILPRLSISSFGSWPLVPQTSNSFIQRLPRQCATPLVEQTRTKVRYSRNRGKAKTVHAVPERFYRLNWGIWIRTRAGRGKRLWKKTPDRKYRLRQHVFCTRTQSKLLDKMVTPFWRRRRNFVDDPYEQYHKRHNFDRYFPEKKRSFYP